MEHPVTLGGHSEAATSGSVTRRKRDEPATEEEMQAGSALLMTGSKSKLGKLRKAVLMALCAQRFAKGVVDELRTKDDALHKLGQWVSR